VPDDDEGVRLVVLTPDVTHAGNDANSPAIDLAERILAQRDSGPRLNRNLLVFVAAGPNRLPELRAATRSYLAWRSIVEEHEQLDLTAHQRKQAASKVTETSQQVDSLIAETFTAVLTPSQAPGTSTIIWQVTKATTTGDIAIRVSKKLATEEKLIAVYGGVRVKMDVDRYDLWSDRHDIAIRDLWATYARYPHMPRLTSFAALAGAISDGTSNLNWSQETFGYAEAHDGGGWVGVRSGQHVDPMRSGLLIHPAHVPSRDAPDNFGEGSGPKDGGTAGGGTKGGGEGPGKPAGGAGGGATSATQFYALFNLDPVRGIKQLGQILEHVTGRLGANVELSLEVRATKADGFDDAAQRIVTENASNLGAKAAEFE
jgi:hypothetical protein